MSVLNHQVSVVTGSSRGIGAAIAELFAHEGAFVVVHGRDGGAVERVCAKIKADGGTALGVTAELTRFDEIEAMRRRLDDRFGPADIVVANAGGSPVRPSPVEAITEADWRASVDANLTATFLTIKSFLPGMKGRGHGTVITMSSAAARRPHPGSPIAYAAAKAGIELLTKDTALQAGPAGVRVNCLSPETIMTERNQQEIPASMMGNLIAGHPIQRLGTPDDVAQAALFLASDRASWISGVTLDVAGGSVLV
jgi:3-oxoacyl-[acyl-carrier protein] reductase